MSDKKDSFPTIDSKEELKGKNIKFPETEEIKIRKQEEKSKGSNEFVEYVIYNEKLDELLQKIGVFTETLSQKIEKYTNANNTLTQKIENYIDANNSLAQKIENNTDANNSVANEIKKLTSKLSDTVDLIAQSNNNQTQSLSLLSSLVVSLNKLTENKEKNK